MRGKKYRLLLILALICSIALSIGGTASADSTLVVKPSAPNGWGFGSESGATGAGSFVTGPPAPPLGIGSFYMKTPDGADGYITATLAFIGTPLDELTTLTYSTYRSAGGAAPLIALQLVTDFDSTDANESYQGRLVFEPYQADPSIPANNTWQTWDALDGVWWGTLGSPAAIPCPQSNPCSWTEVLDEWPDARIHAGALVGAVILKAGSGWPGFEGNVDALTVGVNGTDTTFDFEPETPCTDTCYVNAATGNDAFGGDSATSAKKTIQAAVNAVDVGGDVIIAAGTYNEQVSVNKNGLTITGAGPDAGPTDTKLVSPVVCSGSTVGIKLLGSHTGTALSGLSVSGYDIGLHVGENIGFTVTDLSITNVNASNNCIHGIWSQAGTTNGVLIDDITASNNGTFANFGRGVWMINGHKEDITIQNSTFSNNGLVGIDLSDGDVTGANITGNTVSGNGDSGIGVLGPEGPDANFVTNNTVTNNGRYGIEIKNPSGTTTVSGNTVSLIVLPVTSKAHLDYAGIAVFRRFPGAANADQPSGVSVTGNTVSGYTNPANPGEGFGIVVEGTGMTVTNNTVSGNDIGVQVQEKNPDIISPETNGTPFFDRGNASVAANVLVNYNNITSNLTFGVRAQGTTTITDATLNWWNTVNGPGPVGPGTGDKVSANVDFCPWLDGPFDGGGSVIELVKNTNTSLVYCTIQSAIDDPATLAGHTIEVAAHTFVEQVDDHKGVILVGAGAGSSFIKAPASIPAESSPLSYIVRFTSGGSSEISGFTITGPGPSGCGSIRGGILVRNGSDANIHDNTITAIRDNTVSNTFSGCQNGVAIEVGRSALSTTGTATIKKNLIEDFQKNGITVSGTGSSAVIEENEINGAGPTTVIAQNAIQFSPGTSGSAKTNQITGSYYTGDDDVVATGVLSWGDVTIDGNTFTDTQVAIYQIGGTSTHKNNIINSKDYLAESGWGVYGIIAWGGKADIIGNTLTGDEGSNSWGIDINADSGSPAQMSATKNVVSKFTDGIGVYGTNFAFVNINRNSITGNGDGLYNANTFLVDGTCNWWGAANGPSGVGPGSGDTVSANVDFLPWLTTDELDGPCLGGYPQLVVEKKVINGDTSQVFPYELSGAGTDSFNLEDGDTEPLTLPYGQYTLVENIPAGWQMSDIVCYETIGGERIPTSDQSDFSYERDPLTNLAYGITFTLDEDGAGVEPIYCVFEQLEIPNHIIIKKIVESGDTSQVFDYHLTGTVNYDFDLTHGTTEIIPLTVPGSYQIVEDVPFGWQMTDLRCEEANGLDLPVPPGGDFEYVRDSNNLAYGFTFERGNGQWEPVYCEFKQKQLEGKLTVKKDTQNPSSSLDDFQFTVSGGSTAIAPFVLDDSVLTPGKPVSKTFPVLSDFYTITETPEPGWHLTGITCAAKPGQGDVIYTPNLATHSVEVGVGGGQEVTCTFVNQKGSVISATKYHDKNKDGDIDLLHGELRLGGWEFTLYSADGSTVVAGPITTDEGGLDKGSANFTNLPAGTYLLCETDDRVPSLWTNTQPGTIYDPPNAPCYQVTVGYNALAIKLFGNYEIPQADLVVTKTDALDPIALGAGDIVYTITVKNNGPDTAKNVTLVDTLPANATFVSSVPGAPTCVFDSAPDPDTVTCDLGNIGDDDTEVVTITVTPNEVGEVYNTATATSTTNDTNPNNNTDDETTTVTQPLPTTGTIIVKKTLEPDGPTEFPFEVRKDDILLPADDGQFDLGDDGIKTLDNLVPGTYNINEVAFEIGYGSGFIFGGASCDDGTTLEPGLGVYNLDVTLEAGETITCEFTNYENSNIIIFKETIPDGDSEKFAFTSSHPALDGNEISDGQSFDFTEFVPGTYTVTETEEAGWTLTDITCEGVPENQLDIDEANRTVDITVGYGDTVECTFTNTKDPGPTTGTITVVKNWSSPVDLSFPSLVDAPQFNFGFGPIGSETSFDLPAAAAGINGTASEDFVREPGVYRLYESPESGWAAVISGVTNHEAVCTMEGENGTLVDYNLSASLDIDLKAGDHITCTFTNELVTYDFTVTKELADGAAVPGSDWAFDIYLSNSYLTDADDEFAESFTLPAAGGSKTYVVTTDYWKVAETVLAGYDLTGVTCTAGENIPNPSNDAVDILVISDNECTFLNDEGEPEPAPTLTVSKTDGQTSVTGETDLTYTITVKNTGNATATTVTLTDDLPVGVMFLSGSTDTGACAFPAANTIINAGNKTFTCDLGDLAPDDVATITVTVDTPAVTEAKDLTNKACADAENADKVCATDTTTVTPPGGICANGGDWRKDLKHNQSKLFGPGETVAALSETLVPPGYYIGQVKNINKTGQNCTYLVGLAAYGKFDEIIDNQILMDWDWPRYVGPNETIYLRVAVPECAQQIDLFYGEILWSLDGQRYGNRLLDWHHVLGKQYCAAIRVRKVTEPAGDAQNFDFTIPQLGENFSLADGGVSEWFVYNPADYGLVQVNEAFVDGWTVDNGPGKSACKTQTDAFANYLFQAPINPGDPTGFDVTALPGEKITCKFVNVKDATLTIVKKVITSGIDTLEFPFEISDSEGIISEPEVADGGSHSETLPAGTYTVKETAFENGFESGYVYGKVECTNGASSNTVSVDVTLNPGDHVTCTFVNKRKASVTIYKEAETIKPADDTQFVFTGDFSVPFQDTLGNGDWETFYEQLQQTYTVTETIPDDWALEDIVCERSNGDAYPHYSTDLVNGELTLELKWGDIVKCTFYNVQYRLEIQKTSDPAFDENVYFSSETLPDTNGGNPGNFSANGNGGIHAYFIKPGVYDITELVPEGYALDEVTCNDPEQATPTITDDTVTIDLTEGNVTCNFYNVGVGSIQVIKDVSEGDESQDFTFTINKLFDDPHQVAQFDLDDDADGTLSNTSQVYEVPVGTYIVSEGAEDGWSATITCVDQDNNPPAGFSTNDNPQPYTQFNVELGKHIVCTFVNSYTPPVYNLTIQKSSDPGYDAQVYFSSNTIPDVNGADPGNFSVNGMDGQYTFENLEPGIYDATELVPDGYVLDHVSCNQVDVTITNNGVSIDLTQGDVICVFYNVEEEVVEEWDKSSIQVTVESVDCDTDTVTFRITNVGSGDMVGSHEWRLYEGTPPQVYNEPPYATGMFQLTSGDSILVPYTGQAQKVKLEADQHPLHPGSPQPQADIEWEEECPQDVDAPEPENESPTAVISGELTQTLTCEQSEVTFNLNGLSSTDGDGNIVSYAWSTGETSDSISRAYGEGSYPISLTVTDDDGATGLTDATLTVNGAQNCAPPLEPPTANDDNTYTTSEGQVLDVPVGQDVLLNDTVNTAIISSPTVGIPTPTTQGGSVTLNADGSFSYTPPALVLQQGQSVPDTFQYTLTNGAGADNATVTITINGTNVAPVISDASVNPNSADLTCEQTEAPINLSVTASDGDNDTLTYAWTGIGVSSGEQNPVVNLSQTTDVTITVSDPFGGQDARTFTVTINPAQLCEVKEDTTPGEDQ